MDLILSWTPKEFEFLMLGARHKQIDSYEFMAKSALANAYATNAKRPKEKSIFNADKARKMIERGYKGNVAEIEKERVKQMRDALKGFKPNFTPKKGG